MRERRSHAVYISRQGELYLEYILDEHVDLKVMVGDRVRAGSKALWSWWEACRRAEGQVNGHTFLKIMEVMINSVVHACMDLKLCCTNLDQVDQLRMLRALIDCMEVSQSLLNA